MGRVPSQPSSETLAGSPAAPARSIDWLDACRRIVVTQRTLLAETAGIAARSRYEGRGAGGDASLVIDRRCEDVVFAELERVADEAGQAILAVSEERGEVAIGAGETAARVVIDPIDGSLNARRTIPSHSLSIAVASGDSMADVEFGFVHDFGAGEEFSAWRGEGARLDGAELDAGQGKQGVEGERAFEIVGIEAADPGLIGPVLERLAGHAYRLRAIGSIAISLCYVAAGRFDGLIAARPCRSVDAAAAQLIAREAGAAAAFKGLDLDQAALGIDARYLLVAARDPAQLEILLAAASEDS
ncbi:MAG: monophosphatase [Solirubrobacterales bacterium]|jgi:myo-inositol-1(or 4)-monophosphatase|nr:monophosphatase [Solirubrobacterales bacterium]MDX6662587.1 monophosphatase [Solirubrobacterales bacterium]